MGYTTEFNGTFKLDRPLAEVHRKYLEKFSQVRHMKRDVTKALTYPDPLREAVGLPIGPQGCYFTGGNTLDEWGPDIFEGESVTDMDTPPVGQPGLWCQWVPCGEYGASIGWDEGEKFYNYVEWLEDPIEHFLEQWKYVLNGEVEWTGEDREDVGKIVVTNNRVTTKQGRIVFD